MNRNQTLLRHFVAAIAYRGAKALRDAPPTFATFEAGEKSRTPRQLVRHMSGVLNYAIAQVHEPRPPLTDRASYELEVERFFAVLRELSERLEEVELSDPAAERLLQGPLADAMTHAGQLALLRRLSGSPIPPEDFYQAAVDAERLGLDQLAPRSPDRQWPEAPDGWTPPAN